MALAGRSSIRLARLADMDSSTPLECSASGGESAKWVEHAEWAADKLMLLIDYLLRDAELELALLTSTHTP